VSAEKPSLTPEVIDRLLSVTDAKAQIAKLHTPTMRARIEELRRRQAAGGDKAPKDLLAWEGFVDAPAGARVSSGSDGLLEAELAANPFRQIPKDDIARLIAETEAALATLTPGSEEACAVILAAVEAGAPIDAFDLPPPPAAMTPSEALEPKAPPTVEPTPAAVPERASGRPRWLVPLLGLLLLAGGLGVWLLVRPPAQVPPTNDAAPAVGPSAAASFAAPDSLTSAGTSTPHSAPSASSTLSSAPAVSPAPPSTSARPPHSATAPTTPPVKTTAPAPTIPFYE